MLWFLGCTNLLTTPLLYIFPKDNLFSCRSVHSDLRPKWLITTVRDQAWRRRRVVAKVTAKPCAYDTKEGGRYLSLLAIRWMYGVLPRPCIFPPGSVC